MACQAAEILMIMRQVRLTLPTNILARSEPLIQHCCACVNTDACMSLGVEQVSSLWQLDAGPLTLFRGTTVSSPASKIFNQRDVHCSCKVCSAALPLSTH